jgi:hypothetical protein
MRLIDLFENAKQGFKFINHALTLFSLVHFILWYLIIN